MELFLFKFIHIGLPLLLLLCFWCIKPRSKFGVFSSALLNFGLLGFLFLWGQWPIAFSLYYKYVVVLIFIFIFIKSIRRFRWARSKFPRSIIGHIRNLVTLIIGAFMLYAVINIINGLSYPEGTVDLEFPLKNGNYYIASGGSNKLANNHTRNVPTSQQYALDINKIGSWGSVKKSGESTNEAHAIFGEPVYCPCDGRVVNVKTGVADNLGSSMDISVEDGTGNYAEINCNNVIVSFSHLKMGSIKVSVGEKLKQGDLIGEVGNSGFSQEPHLHFQAAKYTQDSTLVGIPMRFKGKFLFRNSILKMN